MVGLSSVGGLSGSHQRGEGVVEWTTMLDLLRVAHQHLVCLFPCVPGLDQSLRLFESLCGRCKRERGQFRLEIVQERLDVLHRSGVGLKRTVGRAPNVPSGQLRFEQINIGLRCRGTLRFRSEMGTERLMIAMGGNRLRCVAHQHAVGMLDKRQILREGIGRNQFPMGVRVVGRIESHRILGHSHTTVPVPGVSTRSCG